MKLADPAPRPRSLRAARILAGSSAVALLALLALVLVHAEWGSSYTVPVAEGVSLAFALLAVSAATVGVYHAWASYPMHRKAIILIVVITAATLAAHAYVIGNPPAYEKNSVSGHVGTTFSDGIMSVDSSITGDTLNVSIQPTTGRAGAGVIYAHPVLGNSSGALGEGGFVSSPDFSSPAESHNVTTGTWSLNRPVTSLNITYDLITCYSQVHQGFGCIMDEVFYVPEGMGILAGQQCSIRPAPVYCRLEHPPLAPALMAAGMAIMGEYNSAGWRLFPALLGTLSVPVLFGIAWELSRNMKLSLAAATLLALDVMFFSQSGAGVLDVPQVFFGLAAFLAYLVGVRWWKFDKYVVSGVLMGLAGLAKETGVFLVLALVTWILVFERGPRREKTKGVITVILTVGVVFAAGLQVYDSTLTQGVPTFLDQVRYMLTFGSGSLNTVCPWHCGWINGALPGFINPLDWIVFYSPVPYFVDAQVAYFGITNLLLTWSVFAWVPLVVYELRRRRTSGRVDDGGMNSARRPGTDARAAAFALNLFFWTYVPYIPLFLAGRVTYPFYFVPAIPAVALGAAWWGTRRYFPKWLLAAYLGAAFVFFLAFFPDKSFLPGWMQTLLKW